MTRHRREQRFAAAAGPLSRSYMVTRGRTRPRDHPLELITLVVTLTEPGAGRDLEPESRTILGLCRQTMSVAEVAARMQLPLPVVKVLLSDLIDQKHLTYRTATTTTERPDRQLLQRVLDGLLRL